MTKLQRVIATSSGPLISAFFTFIFYFFLHHPINKYYLITGMFWLNFIQFVMTAIPIIYPKWWGPYGGYSSDGYKILKVSTKKGDVA
ncbi:hypothetical protein [Virgibacillus proomii]|uniref:hypothetical protein n=1 Tax=Virgibacillus proomii TaxID=84407 RepID=UPI001C108E1A|nr:hypothetical protein [Virgibacillus proomii]MBU5266845.1 hypothetical protein [Virgibacillus proomii]